MTLKNGLNSRLQYSPIRILIFLISVIFILFCLNILSITFWYNENNSGGLFEMFNFNKENNIPTFFSVVILFLSSLLLWIISIIQYNSQLNYKLWSILALCFLLLSIDESIQIHERVSILVSSNYTFTGYLYYAWVVPYSVFLVFFTFIYYFYFLRKLPKDIMRLIIYSGIIYIIGAIGFEMLGASERYTYGMEIYSSNYSAYYTFEELLEMLGIALFIYTLLLYIKEHLNITIIVRSK